MIEDRLRDLGISLPAPPAPAGSYVPVVVAGKTAYVSGQIPVSGGRVAYTGRVTDGNMSDAKKSAEMCAVNILAHLKKELGDLERVSRIVRISGFVNSDPGFARHPEVINAASDLLFGVFGERGRHARIALGASSLPLDSMTEIDAVVRLG